MAAGEPATSHAGGRGDEPTPAVFIDLDTVLLAMHQGRRGLEIGLQADLPEAIERLREISDRVVVLVDPPPVEGAAGRETQTRLAVAREGLGDAAELLTFVTCPHGERRTCECSKPDSGLIELALTDFRLRRRGSWYIGGDQEGMQAARGSALHTVRIGPLGDDHLDVVHRPDHEARDLLDAANRIMLQVLTTE
jgi:D-glycero-D-manno-heptose 1,7-bisphosphate phosphatase